MRYTIEGFSQARSLEFNLDVVDLVILRWIVDFYNTDKMMKMQVDNKVYFWVKYEAVIEDLPILNINTKDSLYRRLKKLVMCGVLEHKTIKQGGTFSMYRFGDRYKFLLSDEKSEGTDEKSEGVRMKSRTGTDEKSEQNINILNNKSTKNINPLSTIEGAKPSKKKSVYVEVYSDPNYKSIIEALKVWEKYCRDIGRGYKRDTFVRWAKFLSDSSKNDPEIALEIVNQSITKGWKDLYELKDKIRFAGKSKPFDKDNTELADVIY